MANNPNSYILEADGGSRGNPGESAYGFVVYRNGNPIWRQADLLGTQTNNVAEYSSLIYGLKYIRELDPNANVLVKMDSQLVVKQMIGDYKIKNDTLKQLASIVSSIFPSNQVTYQWIRREENKAADALVNLALDSIK